MPTKDNVDKLTKLLKSGYKLIHLLTVEESRAEEQLIKLSKAGDGGKFRREYYSWTATDGLRTVEGKEAPNAKDCDNPEKALSWIIDRARTERDPSLYVMKDLHPFIGGRSARPLVIRKVKDTVRVLEPTKSAIILLSGPQLEIPPELEKDIVIVDFELPDLNALRDLFVSLIDEYRGKPGITIDVTDADIDRLAKAAQGLTLAEAELAFGQALTDDKRLDANDVAVIQEEKKQIVRKTGILTVEEPVNIDEVGGLEVLKEWLDKRREIFSEEARKYGIPSPKGALLTGVPGCGKSLCARAMADKWKVPILRLDMGAIFGGLVGASEANIRKAIACAKAMAPCVLMIDEIEKGLAGAGGGGGDGGTSTRVFGTLLTWMSDKTEAVFVVATANEFDRLPPEMLRKGRFDELFFVDFPHEGERSSILEIHIKKALKRRIPQPSSKEVEDFLAGFELDSKHTITREKKDRTIETKTGTIVQLTLNFTGSEIEEAVKTAMIHAFADGKREFNSKDVALAIAGTVPLIDTMAAKIEAIRTRAGECTISASRFATKESAGQVLGEGAQDASAATQPPSRGGRFDVS